MVIIAKKSLSYGIINLHQLKFFLIFPFTIYLFIKIYVYKIFN